MGKLTREDASSSGVYIDGTSSEARNIEARQTWSLGHERIAARLQSLRGKIDLMYGDLEIDLSRSRGITREREEVRAEQSASSMLDLHSAWKRNSRVEFETIKLLYEEAGETLSPVADPMVV